jgi:hypothetical protein
MLLTLEPLKAAEGDCLLLYWGTAANNKLAIIDGGPGNIYQDQLRPRLEDIRNKRGLSQLIIDLAMVSHVDNDHIVGVKKLFRQLKDEVMNNVSIANRPFSIKRLWHNTFNDVLNDGLDKYYTTLTASLASKGASGDPNPEMIQKLADAFKLKQSEYPDADAFDVALILAGHGEGRDLRNYFGILHNAQLIATLNAPFQKNGKPTLITLEMTPTPVSITGLTFRIIGPMQAEIDALQKDFDKYIKQNGMIEASLLAAYADKSIKNLSSIVCLLEMGGKRILLTGDARGDKILDGLTKAGLLNGEPFRVDVLKVPHHGSDRNVTKDFFKRIIAQTYVFSGNGKHGNPERDTLKWLTESRNKNDAYKIVLTYPIKAIDAERKHHALSRGKPWKSDDDSLEVFFKKCEQDGFNFTLQEGAPFKIDLGDESVSW